MMGLFNKKQVEQSKLYDELRLNAVKIAKLEGEMESLRQVVHNLRGLVNRKLHNYVDKEEEQTESIKKSDSYEPLRGLGV